jgi:hypothetical protein
VYNQLPSQQDLKYIKKTGVAESIKHAIKKVALDYNGITEPDILV